MTAPDDGQTVTLPGAGHGALLRAELMETVVRSQAELAGRILDSFQREHHRLIFDQGQIWRYDTATGLFLTVEDAEIRNIVYDLDGIPFGERGHLSVTAHFARGIAQIIKDRTSQNGFFGNSPTGVVVANGFLMEQDGHVVLRPHSPKHRQQTRLEVEYRPDADASAIDEFLLETFEGDQSLVDLIYEIIGVAIFGCGTRYHIVFVFCGEGANGKGVIVALIQMLIPDGMRSSVNGGVKTGHAAA